MSLGWIRDRAREAREAAVRVRERIARAAQAVRDRKRALAAQAARVARAKRERIARVARAVRDRKRVLAAQAVARATQIAKAKRDRIVRAAQVVRDRKRAKAARAAQIARDIAARKAQAAQAAGQIVHQRIIEPIKDAAERVYDSMVVMKNRVKEFVGQRNFIVVFNIRTLDSNRLANLRRKESNILRRLNNAARRVGWHIMVAPGQRHIITSNREIRFKITRYGSITLLAIVKFLGVKGVLLSIGIAVIGTRIILDGAAEVIYEARKPHAPTVDEFERIIDKVPEEDRAPLVDEWLDDIIPDPLPHEPMPYISDPLPFQPTIDPFNPTPDPLLFDPTPDPLLFDPILEPLPTIDPVAEKYQRIEERDKVVKIGGAVALVVILAIIMSRKKK